MTCSNSEFKFSEYMNLWTFGRTPWTGNQLDARPLPIGNNKTEKRGHTYMPREGFETTIPVFQRSVAVRAFRPRGDWDRPRWVHSGLKWVCLSHSKTSLVSRSGRSVFVNLFFHPGIQHP